MLFRKIVKKWRQENCGVLTNELRVPSYEFYCELLFIAGVTSYILRTSYELLLIAQVTSWFLHAGYELLFIARVTSENYHTSY